MAEQEQINDIKQANVRLEPTIFEVLERMRTAEKRPMANMIAFLLETHPRVEAAMLETEPATAAAGN